MELTLRLGAGAPEPDELRSLRDSLADDPEVGGAAEAPPAEAQICLTGPSAGTVIDVISLVVGSGFSAASLGLAVANWRAGRTRPPSVTITRPDGTSITLTHHTPEEAVDMARRLLDESPSG